MPTNDLLFWAGLILLGTLYLIILIEHPEVVSVATVLIGASVALPWLWRIANALMKAGTP